MSNADITPAEAEAQSCNDQASLETVHDFFHEAASTNAVGGVQSATTAICIMAAGVTCSLWLGRDNCANMVQLGILQSTWPTAPHLSCTQIGGWMPHVPHARCAALVLGSSAIDMSRLCWAFGVSLPRHSLLPSALPPLHSGSPRLPSTGLPALLVRWMCHSKNLMPLLFPIPAVTIPSSGHIIALWINSLHFGSW